jgi:exosortase A
VVAPIAAWLVWRRRTDIAKLVPRPSWLGVLALAACCVVWMTADLASINVVAHYAVTAMLIALVIAMAGWRVAAAIAFPLAFLFFMVPAGEALNPPLMEGTANATIWAVQASGIPVFREGLIFTLPTGRWSVVEACSGLRYVLASSMLGALFAYLNFERWPKRLAFFLASIGVAIFANWMRAYLIVMVGHFSNMKYGTGDDHVVYGWVFFGITMFALFWMGARWRDPLPATISTNTAPNGVSPLDALLAPGVSKGTRRLILIAALATIGLTYGTLSVLRDVTPRTDFEQRARQSLQTLKPGPIASQPHFEGARAVVQGTLDPTDGTDVYLAYFARQHEGAEMVAFGNTVLADTDKVWQMMSRQDVEVAAQSGQPAIAVRQWHLRQGNRERLVWSWFTVGGRAVPSEYQAKALTAWSMLSGQGDHSTVAVVSTEIPSASGVFGDAAASQAAIETARSRLQAVLASVQNAARVSD